MISEQRLEELMRAAVSIAEETASRGNEPFAALLLDSEGNIVCSAGNSEADDGNPSSHAEMALIRKACAMLGTRDLSAYAVMCNAESCPMCASALTLCGVRTFYTGAKMEPFCNPYIRMRDMLSHCVWPISLTEGILQEECAASIRAARQKKAAADLSLREPCCQE